MLTYWLPGERGVPSSLPPYNTHSLGVGAVVLNARGEILAVQVSTETPPPPLWDEEAGNTGRGGMRSEWRWVEE
jgi:hypothetical protein